MVLVVWCGVVCKQDCETHPCARTHTHLVPDVVHAQVVAVEVAVLSGVEAKALACVG